jgi:hypothetical protein
MVHFDLGSGPLLVRTELRSSTDYSHFKGEQYCSLSTAKGRRRHIPTSRDSTRWDRMNISTSEIKPRHFGVENVPICEACKRSMRLTRRAPHPLYGYDYELQSFECRTCGRETHRSADGAGLPHDSDAGPRGTASLE